MHKIDGSSAAARESRDPYRIRGPILDDLRGLLGPKAVHDVRLCARDGAFAFARVRSLDCRGEAPPEEAVLELAEAVPF